MLIRSVKRHGQSPEKINRGMILAPLVGIIVNLVEASTEFESSVQNDLIEVFAKMDCPETVLFGLQYMLEFNWVSSCPLPLSSIDTWGCYGHTNSVLVAILFLPE